MLLLVLGSKSLNYLIHADRVGSNTPALSLFFKESEGATQPSVSFPCCEVETVAYGFMCYSTLIPQSPSSFLLSSHSFPVPEGTGCRQTVGAKDMNGFRCSLRRLGSLHCAPHCRLHPHQQSLTIHISIKSQFKAISVFPILLFKVLPVSAHSCVYTFRCSL